MDDLILRDILEELKEIRKALWALVLRDTVSHEDVFGSEEVGGGRLDTMDDQILRDILEELKEIRKTLRDLVYRYPWYGGPWPSDKNISPDPLNPLAPWRVGDVAPKEG